MGDEGHRCALPGHPTPMILQIISGGQTGVQRAALDAALEQDFPCGGWCPQGRLAEGECIPDRYPLQEMASAHYTARTVQNIRDSDGTLIITQGVPVGRTEVTVLSARKHRKPVLVIDLEAIPNPDAAIEKILTWADQRSIGILNVSGPWESQCPGIYDVALVLMKAVVVRTQERG